MFGLFEPSECPRPYTEKHLDKDINPKRINSRKIYGGNPPLFCAVKSRNVTIVKKLISAGADVNMNGGGYNSRDCVAKLIPHYLADHPDILKVLVDAGIDLNKGSPLQCAAETEDLHLAKLLLKYGANVNHRCQFGKTPVQAAAARGTNEMLKLLIDHGGDVNNIQDTGETPLFVAILGNDPALALAGFGGASPKIDNVKTLIAAGADVNPTSHEFSILELAQGLGNQEVIDLVIKAGAK